MQVASCCLRQDRQEQAGDLLHPCGGPCIQRGDQEVLWRSQSLELDPDQGEASSLMAAKAQSGQRDQAHLAQLGGEQDPHQDFRIQRQEEVVKQS